MSEDGKPVAGRQRFLDAIREGSSDTAFALLCALVLSLILGVTAVLLAGRNLEGSDIVGILGVVGGSASSVAAIISAKSR